MMSLPAQIRNFFTPPVDLPREHKRYYVVVTVVFTAALFAHAFYIALFLWMGLKVLALYNVLSVATYITALWLIRRGHIYTPISLGATEISIFVALCILYIGWESGAIYVFFIVYRMFEKSTAHPLEPVSRQNIVQHYEKNEALAESLEDAHERFIERVAEIHFSSQPHVIRYISEVLTAPAEEDEGERLSDEEVGLIFLVEKTVVDALDESLPQED